MDEHNFNFKETLLLGLLNKVFNEGHFNKKGIFQRVMDRSDSLENVLLYFLTPPAGDEEYFCLQRCKLLTLLKDVFLEGHCSYQETRESVITSLISGLTKEKPNVRTTLNGWQVTSNNTGNIFTYNGATGSAHVTYSNPWYAYSFPASYTYNTNSNIYWRQS